MSKIGKLIGGLFGSDKSILEQAADVADRFILNPQEKKEFLKEAFAEEVKDRNTARELGKTSSTPDVLTYITMSMAVGLGIAIFSDIIDWDILTEVQKGIIQTFLGVFLAKLNDIYAYWFGSSLGSDNKSKDINKMMKK